MESVFKTKIDTIIEEAFQKIGKDAQKSEEQIAYDIHIAKFSLMAISNSFEMGLERNDMNLVLAGVSALSDFHKTKMTEIAFNAFTAMLPGGKRTKPFDEVNHPPKNRVNWQIADLINNEQKIDFAKLNGSQVVFITFRGDFKFGKVVESIGDGHAVIWQDAKGNISTFRKEDVKAICLQDEFAKANFSIMDYYGI